nr:Dnf3 [Starmerella bombicola]
MAEPPIELMDRRPNLRVSTDSLQKDIFDAIRTAHSSQQRDPSQRRSSNVETLRTATSANSLMTRSSYVDFETSSRKMSGSKTREYKKRARHMKERMLAASLSAGYSVFRPLSLLRKPYNWVRHWWERRHTLPPTAAGRKIAVDFANPQPPLQIDERTNKPFCTNQITSSIYTVYDFFPRQLIVQFSKMANLYFLFVAILQMIPSWSATGNYTTIVPLCIFVLISMGREGWEDYNRHKNDKEENNSEVLVVNKNLETGKIEYETKKWKHIKVGDVVRVLQNEWIPADLVLLHSSGVKGQCSVETLALDGETTLKSREVCPEAQTAFNVENINDAQVMVTTEDPNLDLYNFEGTLELLFSPVAPVDLDNTPSSDGVSSIVKGNVVPLESSNVIYRGSALRNTASIIGVCIFTGPETKMQLNASRNSRTKTPKLQGKVNRLVGILAAFVLLLSGFFTLAGGELQKSRNFWYLQGIDVTTTQNIMGFIIMFNTLIPLSLYVSMEICKVFQQFFMQNDIDMYDETNDVRCSVQTASLNEELGQVSYVFSDKTGTLTDNIMLFRKMSIGGHPWIHDLDLYFEEDEDGYLFHKVNPSDLHNLNEGEAQLLEHLGNLPRKSFGGRISNAARTSVSRPSMGRLSMSRPSIGRVSMGRPSVGRPSVGRPSIGRPSLGRPSLGRPSLGRPSIGQSSLGRPSMGLSTMGRPSTGILSRERSSEERSPLKYESSELSPIDSSALKNKATTSHVTFGERPSIARVSTASGSTASNSTAPNYHDNYSRPDSGLRFESPRPSMAISTTGTYRSATQWQSTSAPLKPQSTPSTLTLLEYLMVHPMSAYAVRTKFFLLALALCHSATPEVDLNESGEEGLTEIEQLDYQASSPDELALVAAARDLGYLVIDRQHDSITVRTYPDGFSNPAVDEQYQILDTIEFSSSRKRMSIVIKLPDGRIVVLCKGADNVMIERLQKSLLGPARTKAASIYQDALTRRSVEAELAFENRAMAQMEGRPSVDSFLQRKAADLAIQESGRRSMQLRHKSSDVPIPAANRSSIQSAVADATARASINATRTSISLDINQATTPISPTVAGHAPLTFAQPQPHQDELDLEQLNEREILEKTLEQIDEFSTEGLRTLLYGHKFISAAQYEIWKKDYDEARAAISDRQAKVEEVGERLENDFSVTGATAIEDKLQLGVPEAIDKLRRAGIRMWMLTGDKRETAVNIGYSCRLIKDFSTVISLSINDDLEAKIMAALEELDSQKIVHCVVVADGQTLSAIEKDPIMLSLFIDLGLRADSAIVCRASPAQKANIVKCVRQREPSKVMLAIGDGANDIAMIQAADVGVGIAGREGLQAARSSDFSIGQFRFLLKLLLVHGRWNYVRTCKYVLSTFYKEFMFYMAQAVFQRNTLFTGTSVFESWSISMFNTLFTSLPVICVGIMDQDLSPAALIAVPELYRVGPENREFKLILFIQWICIAMLECLMISFLSYMFYGDQYEVRDNSLFPLGVTIYAAIVATVCFKIQFISMMHYITLISLLVVVISFCGYLLFNILIGLVYIVNPAKTFYAAREFWKDLGKELAFWATVLLTTVIAFLFELLIQLVRITVSPSDTDAFQSIEKDLHIMRRLETESELELHQGWEYQDQLDHSWSAVFRGKWPAQKRVSEPLMSFSSRKWIDVFAEKLRLRKPVDYEKEIQEILERRQQETEPAPQP